MGRATTPNIVIYHSLARVAADGTGLAGVGPPTMQSWDAVTSTDGKQFAFLEADGVGIANADFTDVNRLSTDPATQLAWSGDGTRLALCSCGPLDSPRVAVGRPATCLVSESIPTPYNRFETLDSAIRPAWSLDGRLLVYATTDGLHVLDLRAHDRRIQVPDAPLVRYPVFTRDGHIVFTSTGFGWDAPH